MAIYAAYGANLNPARMHALAPHSPVLGAGWLNGWRLTFGGTELNWGGSLPTLVESHEHQVFVMLYALTDEDEAGLDSAEGFDLGFYRKIHLRVATLERDVTAWTYVLDAYEGGFPAAATLQEIIGAAALGGAPTDYIAELEKRLSVWDDELDS